MAARPGRDTAGYHLTRLFSPTAALLELVQNLHTTDETKRREAFNQDLGEPYVPRGGQLTAASLDACCRQYAHLPLPAEQTAMGVDVGKVLHGVIRGPQQPETGETPQRWAGEIDSFDELGRLLKRFNVRRMVIDAPARNHPGPRLSSRLPARPRLAGLLRHPEDRHQTGRPAPVGRRQRGGQPGPHPHPRPDPVPLL